VGSTPASPTSYFLGWPFMRKWVGPPLSFLFIVSLLFIPFASNIFKPISDQNENTGSPRVILTVNTDKEGKGGSEDTYYIMFLKQTREKVDEWLELLNKRIEQEDITHFEVRFYEISRNFLEWLRETIDSKVKSSEEKRLKQKEKERLLKDTHRRIFLPFNKA
jgi:hypothetical protein